MAIQWLLFWKKAQISRICADTDSSVAANDPHWMLMERKLCDGEGIIRELVAPLCDKRKTAIESIVIMNEGGVIRKTAVHPSSWLPAAVGHLAVVIPRLACMAVLMTRILSVNIFTAHTSAAWLQ